MESPARDSVQRPRRARRGRLQALSLERPSLRQLLDRRRREQPRGPQPLCAAQGTAFWRGRTRTLDRRGDVRAWRPARSHPCAGGSHVLSRHARRGAALFARAAGAMPCPGKKGDRSSATRLRSPEKSGRRQNRSPARRPKPICACEKSPLIFVARRCAIIRRCSIVIPALRHEDCRRSSPASPINSGKIMGIHRTFLDPTRNDKANVASPRRSLGAILGNGVRFGKIDDFASSAKESRPSSRSRAPCPNSSGRSAFRCASAAWRSPSRLRRLIIAADYDEPGLAAARRTLGAHERAWRRDDDDPSAVR